MKIKYFIPLLPILLLHVVPLSVCAAAPADTLWLYRSVSEKRSAYATMNYPGNPALAPFRYRWSLSRLSLSACDRKEENAYAASRGSSERSYGIKAESYYRRDSTVTLWGDARYGNSVTQEVATSSVIDYDLLYPHISAYSEPQEMRSQTYAFTGGCSYRRNKWTVGVALHLDASSLVRRVDPRLFNIASDIEGRLGVSRSVGNGYGLHAGVLLNRYKQDVKSITGQSGVPDFVLNGPFIVFRPLSEPNRPIFYTGVGYGCYGGLFRADRRGLSLGGGYRRTEIDRKTTLPLAGGLIVPFSTLAIETSDLDLSYRTGWGRHVAGVRFTGTYRHKKTSEEAFFIQQASTKKIYHLEQPYFSHEYGAKLQLLYGYRFPRILSLECAPYVQYGSFAERYLLPRQQRERAFIDAGVLLQLQKIYRRHFIGLDFDATRRKNNRALLDMEEVKGPLASDVKPMAFNKPYTKFIRKDFERQTSDAFLFTLGLDYAFSLNENVSLFLKGAWTRYRYMSPLKYDVVELKTGIVF